MKKTTSIQEHQVPFWAYLINAVRTPDGEIFVVLKPMCALLGIGEASQRRKLQQQDWATGVLMTVVAADGRRREQYCLRSDCIEMWLANLNLAKIDSPAARHRVAVFQKEAAAVLHAYFAAKARGDQAAPARLDADASAALAELRGEVATLRAELRADRGVLVARLDAADALFRVHSDRARASEAQTHRLGKRIDSLEAIQGSFASVAHESAEALIPVIGREDRETAEATLAEIDAGPNPNPEEAVSRWVAAWTVARTGGNAAYLEAAWSAAFRAFDAAVRVRVAARAQKAGVSRLAFVRQMGQLDALFAAAREALPRVPGPRLHRPSPVVAAPPSSG